MKLPSIFKGDTTKLQNHNTSYYCINNLKQSNINLDEINENEKYSIKTINKDLETYVVYKNKDYIKTVEGEKILKKEILSIKRIS